MSREGERVGSALVDVDFGLTMSEARGAYVVQEFRVLDTQHDSASRRFASTVAVRGAE